MILENYTVKKNGDIINNKTKRIVKPFVNKDNGVLRVTLYVNKQKKHYMVKTLLAMTFHADSYHEELRNQVKIIDETKPLTADNVKWYNYTTHGRK